MAILDTFLGVSFGIVCVLLIGIVLLQKGRGGGLGAAFGGAGSSAFGTRTGDVFTWITIVLTALFLLLAVGSTLTFRPQAQTVLAPVLDPKPVPIDEELEVTVFCPTLGSRASVTLDGSEPLEKKAKARTVTVVVQPGQTLKARAFRDKWEPSDLVVEVYEKKAEPTTAPAEATTRPVQVR